MIICILEILYGLTINDTNGRSSKSICELFATLKRMLTKTSHTDLKISITIDCKDYVI